MVDLKALDYFDKYEPILRAYIMYAEKIWPLLPEKSAQFIKTLEKRYPNHPFLVLYAADMAFEQGAIDKAIKLYRQSDRSGNTSPSIPFLIANELISINAYKKAIPFLDEALNKNDVAHDMEQNEILSKFAEVHFNLGNYRLVLQALTELKKDPKYALAALKKETDVYIFQNKYDKALVVYKEMFERYPEVKRNTSQTFWYRRVYLNDLLNKEPNNIDAKIDLSQVVINQVLHLPFKYQEDAFYIAEGYLEESMKVKTDYVPIYKGLGYLYLNWKKYSKARDNYLEVIRLQPKDANSWYNLGIVEHALGNENAAKTAWKKTLLLDPQHRGAQKAISN